MELFLEIELDAGKTAASKLAEIGATLSNTSRVRRDAASFMENTKKTSRWQTSWVFYGFSYIHRAHKFTHFFMCNRYSVTL